MLRCLSAVLLVTVLPLAALAQPLADRIPDDAVAYVVWRGSEAMGPGYEQSHLKAMLDASQVPQLFDQFLPAIAARLRQENPQAGEVLSLITAAGAPMWKHPTALYFGGIDFAPGAMPAPHVALVCDAGADAPALLERLNGIITKIGPTPIPITAKSSGTVVLVTIGTVERLEQGLLGHTSADLPTLALSPTFKQAAGQVQKDPVVMMYVDVERAMAMMNQGVASTDREEAQANWTKWRDALGLNGLQRVVYSGGLDGKDWTDQMFIGAPAPRSGLLTLIDGEPLSDEALRLIPGSATIAGAWHLDLARLVAEVRSSGEKVDPGFGARFDQTMLQGSRMLGMDIQKDFLGAFGPEWIVYADPTIGGNGLAGMVLVNRPRSAAQAEQALVRVEQMANGMLRQALRQGPTITFYQEKVGNLTVHYLGLPMVAPCWTIADGTLYVALYPQVLSGATAYAASKGPSLADNKEFVALLQRMGGAKPAAVRYMDLPRIAPGGYTTMLLLSRYFGFGDLFGVKSPPILVPPLAQIMPHLSPAAKMAWSDADGWHARSITPFPGSEALATDLSAAMLQQNALAMSILLPSLNRARETANRVKCASNERQIGQGIILYANGHKGHYPPDLGALVVAEPIAPDVFTCPTGGTHLPPAVRTAPAEQQVAWVNANSDYVYVGAGQTTSGPAEMIVLYEKSSAHGGDGMNVLFADGHVDFVSMSQFTAMIEQQQNQGPAVDKP